MAYADKATKRIRTKMKHLEERGKNYNVSSAAGARELACFVWGMMNDNGGTKCPPKSTNIRMV